MPQNDDNDFLTGPVPEPDAEPTAAERAHAKTFADLVDKTLAGRTPPAMSTDDRALLEMATVIRAASGKAVLAETTQRSLVEDALRQAVGGAGAKDVVPITRGRARRWAPWAIATTSTLVAAAAVIALVVRAPARPAAPAAAAAVLPTEWTSRPADPLFGPISHERSGDASTRIDTIFADRLDGYRERELGRRVK